MIQPIQPTPFTFTIAALAVYRVSYLVVYEDGPLNLFIKGRSIVASVPVLGAATQCIYCFSLWVGAIIAVMVEAQFAVPSAGSLGLLLEVALSGLALSGGAILVHEVVEALKAVGGGAEAGTGSVAVQGEFIPGTVQEFSPLAELPLALEE